MGSSAFARIRAQLRLPANQRKKAGTWSSGKRLLRFRVDRFSWMVFPYLSLMLRAAQCGCPWMCLPDVRERYPWRGTPCQTRRKVLGYVTTRRHLFGGGYQRYAITISVRILEYWPPRDRCINTGPIRSHPTRL